MLCRWGLWNTATVVGPALQLSFIAIELHQSRHSHHILRVADFRVMLAKQIFVLCWQSMKFGTFMWNSRVCVKNDFFETKIWFRKCAVVFRTARCYVHLG